MAGVHRIGVKARETMPCLIMAGIELAIFPALIGPLVDSGR